jgi:hypothetical protein
MKYTQYAIDWPSIHPRFKFVGVEPNGKMYAYSNRPNVENNGYVIADCNDSVIFIAQVEPPTENTKCLYERPTMEEKAGLTRLYKTLQKMEAKRLKKQLQKIDEKQHPSTCYKDGKPCECSGLCRENC